MFKEIHLHRGQKLPSQPMQIVETLDGRWVIRASHSTLYCVGIFILGLVIAAGLTWLLIATLSADSDSMTAMAITIACGGALSFGFTGFGILGLLWSRFLVISPTGLTLIRLSPLSAQPKVLQEALREEVAEIKITTRRHEGQVPTHGLLFMLRDGRAIKLAQSKMENSSAIAHANRFSERLGGVRATNWDGESLDVI